MPRGPSRSSLSNPLSSNIVSVLNSPSVSSISPSPEPQHTMVGKKNMRRNPQSEVTMPVTYTPTTHRISKAKKGKRVHACEFPGCNKVFTRAEHRRRHELNHNPEALYRCSQQGCKKAFHRPDLLARHMERHELEAQTDSQWTPPTQAPMVTESASIPHCVSMDNSGLLAATSQPHSMSIGSLVAPGVHPDLANDCSLMWSGVEMPLQPRPSFQNHVPESADDSPFYSSPAETCPSPLSDAAYSLPPHSSSSISSGSVSVIEQYPKGIMKPEVASPLQMHSPLRWDGSDAAMPSHMVPISLGENLIQPPVQCHYPSPTWSGADCLPYEEHLQHMGHFQPVTWAM
ncbi:Zinc finger protein [Penicillium alfredii]|uniref:Zinc finger protein n=1 Tax=Penicillium alfredii TaxID=1506179 RepID=A0A9W9ES33_9EURO|nr:Zinc finger protein [Penicillium alfredii]KAJ5086829.1 Zinc finger protein [Penicillium alfredii]